MTHTDNAAERITITLPPDMLASIKSKVQSGAYSSTSELIREAMRLWQKKEDEHEARLASIRSRIVRSDKSGPAVSLDEGFKSIERLHKRRMKA